MNRVYLSYVKIELRHKLSMFSGLIPILIYLSPLPGSAQVLWSADTSRGTSVFEGLEEAPGTISVAPDPLNQFGKVYKYDMTDTFTTGKERDESRGTKTPSGNFRVAKGGTYYIGWRALWNPMPINQAWVALWQMHSYGPPGEGAPLVLRILNGMPLIQMQNGVNGQNVNFWQGALHLGVWNTFVVAVHLETDTTGWVELWYNGVQQTFINGQTRYNCPTWDILSGSYNLFKWGVYRTGGGDGHGSAVAYMSGAKIGLTYNDVDPRDK
jgi:hypothetical protein